MENIPPQLSASQQFRPMVHGHQGQPMVPASSHSFHHFGHVPSNAGMPGAPSQPLQYSQPMQHFFPARPGQPAGGITYSSQPIPVPYVQTNRPLTSVSTHQPNAPNMLGLGVSGVPLSSLYTFPTSSYGQQQQLSQLQPPSQVHATIAPAAVQPWLSSGNQSAQPVSQAQQTGQQTPITTSTGQATNGPSLIQQFSSEWQEHTSADGRKYFYNRQTKQSRWEKPLELMTTMERAEASTAWKEYTTPEGKKYYYNKVMKESRWTLPEELKIAREQAELAAVKGTQSEAGATSQAYVALSSSDTPVTTGVTSVVPSTSSTLSVVSPSPVSLPSDVTLTTPSPVMSVTHLPVAAINNAKASPMSGDHVTSQGTAGSTVEDLVQDNEDEKKWTAVSGIVNATPIVDNANTEESLVYATKQDAKNAFKALLESVNVQSDWTWEQAMKKIVNDKRYGALRTLVERKQAFSEYLDHIKKLEAEERSIRQKKAREEFVKMLDESKELTSSMKWSKAVSLFKDDERFKAVERARDREDLFDDYIIELERKERERAVENHRRNMAEYRKFLESCDFINVYSQWRKVQDRLVDDERCSRLKKIDRLLGFEEYIADLKKEEEEQKTIQKEQLRHAERKNRDAFRKMMEEHVAAGALTAKTHWRDYCMKVKELPQYQAVASNTSGATPKDLFEDVTEELDKQYHDDKSRIKNAMKARKISMVSTWTFEDFKAAISEDVSSQPVSNVNLKLVYEDLLERAKEKDEKEANKHQRLASDFTKLLLKVKEISVSSNWEYSKALIAETQEYRSIGDESVCEEIFEEHIKNLQEKAKEKEKKREEEKVKREEEREEKEKRKERKEKERDPEKKRGEERSKREDRDSERSNVTDAHKEDKRRGKERGRKHRKRHRNSNDDVSPERDDKQESRKLRRHGDNRKKSRTHGHSQDSEGESKDKTHKKEHRESSYRNVGNEELEEGELGEDGEIR